MLSSMSATQQPRKKSYKQIVDQMLKEEKIWPGRAGERFISKSGLGYGEPDEVAGFL